MVDLRKVFSERAEGIEGYRKIDYLRLAQCESELGDPGKELTELHAAGDFESLKWI
ncbi:predicted protein [Sclerotinia sclerotiorum 1980 UF-70]|uniref:Uncharacterized protein n=1 Tax=Sclerotinia sclerotiorum (strain ATCC 18683 / 1980 / Ss-1) TaxID=665079 RepID=A7F7W3_SCLS1|nr:predicted protein [Sclerotinia sclerotiorum 1980 UF-70]EDN98834.1 predicted protein [Sclerotinia sclerotiorum 1980 UF-70]